MRAAYDKLLEEVCVRLGFCGSVVDGQPLHVDQFLPQSGVLTNEEFADALFKAEGWDPDGLEAGPSGESLKGHQNLEAETAWHPWWLRLGLL
ncbi:hypothetical protein [Phenylobacterium sp.]|uniref:hypothetical protein n=1 Tax=Phenylobacterium sp. TaxID=1871053 RepID=UPI0039839151